MNNIAYMSRNTYKVVLLTILVFFFSQLSVQAFSGLGGNLSEKVVGFSGISSSMGKAIDFTNTYNMRFKDLHISSWKQNGLYTLNTIHMSGIYFDTVYVYSSDGDGGYINGGSGLDISGLFASKLWFIGNGGHGLRLLNITDPEFSLCSFDSNGMLGFRTDVVNYLHLENSFVGGNNATGLHLSDSYSPTIIGNTFDNNRNPGVAGGISINIEPACYRVIIGHNIIVHTLETSNIGVLIQNGATNVSVTGNDFRVTDGDPVQNNAPATAGIIIRDNTGYITENSGTATMLAGTGSISGLHGLAGTPTRIIASMTSNPGIATSVYCSANVTNYTISVSTNVTNGTTFDWRAWIGEGN